VSVLSVIVVFMHKTDKVILEQLLSGVISDAA